MEAVAYSHGGADFALSLLEGERRDHLWHGEEARFAGVPRLWLG